ncbi:MAG: hypothetical protein P4M11_13975 [Candidatus Pacebacteria bacterium]|nr:hypothetical protein [Candidatus Paceibacterota bacterium]
MHEYLEIADNALIEIIKEKHEQVQQAFASLGALQDDVTVAFNHIAVMKLINRDLRAKVGRSLLRTAYLRRREERQRKVREVLRAISEVRSGMAAIDQGISEGRVEAALDTYTKTMGFINEKLNYVRIVRY